MEVKNVIDGKIRGSDNIHHAIDPSTQTPLWDVPIATEQDLEEAVTVAQKAFISWSATTWQFRQSLIAKMSEILSQHQAEMADILLKEGGKPIQFAALEVQNSIKTLDFHANTPALTDSIIQDDDLLRLTLTYRPLGVVGAINPWNFPLVISMGKIAAGLLTGNTVIVKPSPFTPYSILKFVEWVQPCLPAGVLQALNGDDKLGPAMVSHPGISKISFTGSTATGRRIMESGGRSLKRMTLELGGNDACIVCPDVDIAKIAEQVALGAFFNSGQICVASKRIYVHKDIYSLFLKEITDVVKAWKVGSADSKGVMLGPVQNAMQYRIVKGYFDDCKRKGYKFAIGGEIMESDGLVIQPAIVDNPPDDSMIVTGEPFGPIVPILSWSTEDEVISRANNTTSGLGGSVWSANLNKAYELAGKIESGSVWINGFGKPLPQAYFSGHKDSGVGGELGVKGLQSYCNTTVIHHYKENLSKL